MIFMRKRSILLLGLVSAIAGVIASEVGRRLYRSRMDNLLSDPRENQPDYGRPLPHAHSHSTEDEKELWITPLPQDVSHLSH